jgi:hypothetical protein
MNSLMTVLFVGAVIGLVSAATGIQSVHSDLQSGTVMTYLHGYGRLVALAYAVLFALAFYGIYRRYPLVWKLGFAILYLGGIDFVFHAWRSLWPKPYGWVGAAAVTVVTPFIILYSVRRWRGQKEYFFGYEDEQT